MARRRSGARARRTIRTLSKGRTGAVVAALLLIGIIASAAGSCSGSGGTSTSEGGAATTSAAPAATAAGAASAASVDANVPDLTASGDLVVRFVDVGQGDASILEFPDGKTMLIDTAADGETAVASQLDADGRPSIDWLVATHPDADHIGGLASIISSRDVASVWAPNVSHDAATYERFLQSVADAGLMIDTAQAGKRIAEGDGYTIDLLWPPADANYDDTNAYSAVVLVTYGSTKLLFTGDAPVEALKQAQPGHVDVLKVAHHGSASGTDDALAQELTPQIAVISYGVDNDYGHPTQVVLDALLDVGATVYGTGPNGTVTVTSDGTSLAASVQREGKVISASKDAGIGSRSLEAGSGGSSGDGGGSRASGAAAAGATAAATGQSGPQVSGNESAADTVYVTPSGKKYHQKDCSTLSNSSSLRALSRSEAESEGYTACKVCGG